MLATYAVLLTTATHWPELTLGPAAPATDKMIHFLAFAILATLLVQARPFRRWWANLLVAAAWAPIDELTQGLPMLNRVVSWQDLTANLLGVVVVGAFCWALAPVGGKENRLRLARQRWVLQDVLMRPRVWALLAAAMAACAAPLLLMWRHLPPRYTGVPTSIAAMLWAIVCFAIVWNLCRLRGGRLERERLCFGCGSSCDAATLDDHGTGRCASCGHAVRAAQWIVIAPPPPRVMVGLTARPLISGLTMIGMIFGLVLAAPFLYAYVIGAYPYSSLAPRVARFIGTASPSLALVVDLAVFAVVVALAARMYRHLLATFYEGTRCRRCGHDLRGTPADQGTGRCGECGLAFVRLGTDDVAGAMERPA